MMYRYMSELDQVVTIRVSFILLQHPARVLRL